MTDLPLEVKLVKAVRSCRTCQWFWGGTPPYGNFPLFDWNEDFPEEIRSQKQTTEQIRKTLLTGKACGQGQIDPGIMHGCRKAPIMTIGINPNMTAYFPSSVGAQWSYPKFNNDAKYAYYYRHHNVYQESLDINFIRENIVSGTEIIAQYDGWLISSRRSSDHRWMLLTIQYIGIQKPIEIEVAWSHDNRFVVVVNQNPKMLPTQLSFKRGEIIGGKIFGLEKDNIQIYENSTGYYQRYVHVLERFKKIVGGELENAPLSISEDVAQHDLIACASPGWSSAYDIPTEKIAKNCVTNNAWLISQLIQTKPAVIVIVGSSSLEMFAQVLGAYFKDFNFQQIVVDNNGRSTIVLKETYQLLKETTDREIYMHIKFDNFELKSRIVLSPHFSYASNFEEHSRLSSTAWNAFMVDFSEDAKILIDERRIQENTFNDFVPIRLFGKNDPIKEKLSSSSWNVLMAYYFDPLNMLADVLHQEFKAGRIEFDSSINRLKRANGGCKFCVNSLWSFPEGCPYNKHIETSPETDYLEGVVRQITQQG